MFILTVEVKVAEPHREAFAEAIVQQARTSVALEPDCHRFDVGRSPDDPCLFLLYEVYSDEAAFETHKGMPHSRESGAMTKPWIESTTINQWQSVGAAPER